MTRLIGVGVMVALLLAGVMLAAAAPSETVSASDFTLIALGTLVVLVLLIAARIVAALAALRLRPPSPWLLLGLAAVVVLVWAMLARADVRPTTTRSQPNLEAPAPVSVDPYTPAAPESLLTIVLTLVVGVAVALAGWQAYRWWRNRADTVDSTTTPIDENALLEAIDAALFDLHGQPDPRRAVIAAYAAAEATLAAYGIPRRLSESPIEYLDRILRLLGARGDAVDLLTSLYQQARFSEHTIDATMRYKAIAAFEALRAKLQPVA